MSPQKTESGPVGEACSIDYVRKQIRHIEAGLARAVGGDYTPVALEEADTMWGSFVMHVNAVINATRTALTRAEMFERQAAEARARERAARARTLLEIGPATDSERRSVIIKPHGPRAR